MVIVVICGIIFLLGAGYALINWLKGDKFKMWVGVVVALFFLSIGVPEAINVAVDWADAKANSFFDNLEKGIKY